jgi:hypothetical protein
MKHVKAAMTHKLHPAWSFSTQLDVIGYAKLVPNNRFAHQVTNRTVEVFVQHCDAVMTTKHRSEKGSP